MDRLEERLAKAVAHFWKTRENQQAKQIAGGSKDAGTRGSVTGGAHLNGFIEQVRLLLVEAGIENAHIFPNAKSAVLPGFFRPCKEWDLVVVAGGRLLATIEFKSQVGSFGNNFNNRVEEALGNAVDLHTAYREGAFAPSPPPWLGYLMIVEDNEKSRRPVETSEPLFKVLDDMRNASYMRRYELFCQKLVRERMYDAACFITSTPKEGLAGNYREPNVEIGFRRFAASLLGHAIANAKI